MKAPHATKIPVTIMQHDHIRVDDYQWLRDKNWQQIVDGDLNFANPDILSYLEAEREYTQAMMAPQADLKATLYQEILGRIQEDYQSWPVKKGDYLYYYREEKGLDYPILCRRHLDMTADEQIYLNVNQEAQDHSLYMFGPTAVNQANTHLLYGYNLTGSMERTLKVRDLTTKQDLPWQYPQTTGSVLWLNDDHLLVVERDEASRGKDVYKINIHQGPQSKQLVFSKPDAFEGMFLSLAETTDHRYLMIYLNSGSNQVVYLSKKSAIDFQQFAHGSDDVVYTVEHFRDELYVLTNQDQKHNFQLFKTSVTRWQPEQWQLVMAEQENISLSDLNFYNRYLILEQKNNAKALDELVVIDMDSGKRALVSMPEEAYELEFSGDWDDQATVLRLDYSSPIRSAAVLSLDLATVTTQVVANRPTPNFDSSRYEVKRLYATARDGAEVPVTVVHKKGLMLDGSHKAMIYGYGSYGYGISAGFSSKIFSLIDRGFVYAIAHIRGGDEKGYEWYLNGKMQDKMNTFNDFIDVTDYLIAEGYTTAGQIAINGGSAGGLLMGAVTNMRPSLYGCVVADVPFVDVINTISDASLPLTPPEWEEWGNPITSAQEYHTILQYSPYDNVQAMDYPPMLLNSGISDEQVTYWEPAKMVAKLRALKTDDNILLLNMNMHAGHAGASKRYEWIEEEAFNYAFILTQLAKLP